MPLSEQERRIIAWCEQSWFLHGKLPTPEDITEKFKITPKTLNAFLKKETVQTSFEERGMPVIAGRDLTPTQVTAVNTVLNLTDGRSERKKLQDMGISEAKWSGWKQNPSFMAYYAERAEKILGDAIPDAHLALVDNVKRGDLGAVKFLYEMTGRYTGKDQGIDPRAVINKVFEIIIKHVQDPITLQAIAEDLQLLVALDQPSTITPVATPERAQITVQGEMIDGI